MIDEDQETRESPALNPEELQFTHPDAEPSNSPAAAQARAESGDGSPLERPEVQVLGAFVGAFILAKLLQRLFSSD